MLNRNFEFLRDFNKKNRIPRS